MSGPTPAGATPPADDDAADPVADDLADAYVWGFPLLAIHRTRAGHGPAGVMHHRRRLSTAADRTVVAPNNDTLYSSGFFDLRRGDLVIDVPPLDPARYWSVMLLDAYTNVQYVCRRLHGSAGATVRVRLDPHTPPDPDRPHEVVPVATPTVWVLARVVVDGPDDLDAAAAVQAALRVEQDPRPAPAPAARAGSPAPRGGDDGDWLAALADALAEDPPAPWDVPPPAALGTLLAGPPADPDAVAEGRRRGARRIRRHGLGADVHGNGWGTRRRGADYGGDPLVRAAVARFALAAHLPAENRTYTRPHDGRQGATLRFGPGDAPPVHGFWSLCCYGTDGFFVPNELGRHSVGNRTAGLRRDPDGGLTIDLGPRPPADPANWLPTPEGPCVLALRAYEGGPEVVAARWFPPDLGPAR
ncbi:MAG: phosphatidylserine decarboxylase [Acidimicrobiia bacterium]|nr:MAG: phosphatidylserine decarboxylase [Acidimicrobiia bacterium]